MSGPRGRRIILWRHGQTAWNLERRFQGTTDIELTEDGRGQARRAARLLASLRPHAVLASDLSRAVDTAAELVRITGLDVNRGYDVGDVTGSSFQGAAAAPAASV